MKRAVGYARCSTTKQEMSLPEQRREIERFAAENGYELIEPRFFEDFGVSGVHFEHRAGFQRMLSFCRERRGTIDAVIIWDKSRFGRPEHPKEATAYEWQLEDSGTEIVFASTGRRSDGSIGAVFQDLAENVDAGGKLVELGGSITRHKVEVARAGQSTGRKAPFGFDLEVTKPDGTPRHRVRYAAAGGKNRYRRLLLEPVTGAVLEEIPPERRLEKQRCDRTKLVAGGPAEVAVVRQIFGDYISGFGYRKIARRLNEAGAPSPNGRHWLSSGVKCVIENRVYTGDLVTGMRREGRFFVMDGDRARRRKNPPKTKSGKVRVERKPEDQWLVTRDAHEALVDRETWNTAQRLQAERQRSRSHSGRRRDYLLAGLVSCARCGYRYHGRTVKSAKGIVSRSYACGGYHAGGTSICRMGSVSKEAIEGSIIDMVRQIYFAVEDEEALEEAVRGELGRSATSDPTASEVGALRKRAQALKAKVDGLLDELVALPAEARPLVREKIEAASKEMAWCEVEATRLDRPATRQDGIGEEDEIREVLETIREWRSLFESPDLHLQQELLRHFISEIRIDFESREVVVGFYDKRALFRIESRGERI